MLAGIPKTMYKKETIIFEILKLIEVWIRILCEVGQIGLKEGGLVLSKDWK